MKNSSCVVDITGCTTGATIRHVRAILVVSTVLISLFVYFDSWAAGQELTPAETSKVKAICRSLIGVEGWRLKDIFRQQLAPYIRSKDALEESAIVHCSFRCGGTLKLRDDADIFYGFSNQPAGAPHPVDTVALHIHCKRIFATGPGTGYYPYPYYEAEHRR